MTEQDDGPIATAVGLPPADARGDESQTVAADEGPFRKFPLPGAQRDGALPVVIRQSVRDEIATHGRSTRDIEVCGVLVGCVYHDERGPFLHVEACIRGDHASGMAAQVTFTAETWTHVQDVMERDYPQLRVVGWYHTHPGYGIFLSEMDVFIHANFFNLPWQVAYVFDPKANEEGLFAWTDGKLLRGPFAVESNEQPVTAPRAVAQPSATAVGAPPGTVVELSNRVRALEQRQRWLIAGLLMIGVAAFAMPFLFLAMLPAQPFASDVNKADGTSELARAIEAATLAALQESSRTDQPTTQAASDVPGTVSAPAKFPPAGAPTEVQWSPAAPPAAGRAVGDVPPSK